MSFFISVGKFFRLLDENGQISITNISMYVALWKLYTTSGNLNDIGTFLIAMAAYSYKKYVNTNDQ